VDLTKQTTISSIAEKLTNSSTIWIPQDSTSCRHRQPYNWITFSASIRKESERIFFRLPALAFWQIPCA